MVKLIFILAYTYNVKMKTSLLFYKITYDFLSYRNFKIDIIGIGNTH